MYNIVDSFYAGRISTTALAALGLSFPVYLLIIATSGGLSRGSSALIANAIGSGDSDKQENFINQAISLGVFAALLMMTIGLVTSEWLFIKLGASGEYLQLAQAYMNPIFFGAIFFVMNSLSNAILIASGDSKTYSKFLIAGFFLNLVLDPWFCFGGWGLPAMGVAGVAWATVLIQICGSIFMLFTIVRRGHFNFSPWKRLIPDLKVYGEILYQALPASFSIMAVAMGFFATTFFLKNFGEETVASFGVTTRIEQIVLLPTMGLYAAIMALVGQNNGAKNYARVHETMRLCNRLGFGINVVVSLIMFVFARQLMWVFTKDGKVIEIGVTCLRIIMLVQWSYVLTSTHLAMLQAIKRPLYGFFESPLRKVLLPLPCFWFFVTYLGMGVEAVWYSIAGTNVLMTVVTMVYAQTLLKRLK